MNDKIDALAKAIWQRESPSAIYKALSAVLGPERDPEDDDGVARDSAIMECIEKADEHIRWANEPGRFSPEEALTISSAVRAVLNQMEGLLKVRPSASLYIRERETDFQPAWMKYPKLRTAFQNDPMLLTELIHLLREARADSVRFIKDANGEQIQKARNELPLGVRQEIAALYEGRGRLQRSHDQVKKKCEDLQRELDADTGIIQSHIALRQKAERELLHAKLIVACAWRVHHGGYIEDAKEDLYRTLVRYAPEGDLPEANGEWVRCSPELLASGVDCGSTKRRPSDDPQYSHEHWVVREPMIMRVSRPCVCGHSKASHFGTEGYCMCKHPMGLDRCDCTEFRSAEYVVTEETVDAIEASATEIQIGSRVRVTGVSSEDRIWMKLGTVESIWSSSHAANVRMDDELGLHGLRMDALTLVSEPVSAQEIPMNRFRITVLSNAGKDEKDPLFASRGRVFYVHDETAEKAAERFCKNGIPAKDMVPAAKVTLDDFVVQPATEADIPEKAIENWTKARPG